MMRGQAGGTEGSGGTLEQFSVFALVLILHVMLIFMTGGHLLLCLIITMQDPNLKRKKKYKLSDCFPGPGAGIKDDFI